MPNISRYIRTVLVIDDDPDTVALMDLILTRAGYDVRTASNGLLAIDCIERGERPVVIILDMLMPAMDGRAFLRHRQTDPILARIPVIAVSGTEGLPIDGIQAFIRKPFDADHFLTTVKAIAS